MNLRWTLGAFLAVVAASLTVHAADAPQDAAKSGWWLTPFWEGNVTNGESLFFIQYPGERPTAPLLFRASKILRVVQTGTGITYVEGKDYAMGANARTVVLPEGSRIPFKKLDEMYPDLGAPQSIKQRVDGKKALFFSEGRVYHDLQVEITYEHSAGQWKERGGYIPEPAGKMLAGTMAKLKGKQPFKLVLLGDSISAGANASATTGAPPLMPPYGQLVADGLQARYGAPVEFKNFAVGGKATEWGATEAEKIAPLKPDLTIIAFGMNDASGHRPADVYAANTKIMIDKIRAENPAAEFILVATMEGNPEWSATSEQHYLDYREKLLGMSGQGIVVADMTSVWRELLKFKKFADITGNGVNHPNDFGHRAYAQVLLTLLSNAY